MSKYFSMYDTILIAFAHKLVIALVIKLVILKIVGKKIFHLKLITI